MDVSQLAYDEDDWVMPIGIPLGLTVASGSSSDRSKDAIFGIRSRGSFCAVDELAYALWRGSWTSLRCDALISQIAAKHNVTREATAVSLKELMDNGLIFLMRQEKEMNWQHLAPLRVIPRCRIIGEFERETGYIRPSPSQQARIHWVGFTELCALDELGRSNACL